VKIYHAWTGSMPQYPALVAAAPPLRVLISYAYDDGQVPLYKKIAPLYPLDRIDCMLDSGAFSAWTLGLEVDLQGYIAWARERQAIFGNVETINLDVIPGKPGVKPSPRERLRAIAQSKENADVIRAAGLPVMEVFHLYDGDWRVMEDLWARRRPGELLGIGGLAGLGTSKVEMQDFGDGVFARVREWCGGWQEIVPVHGLGVGPEASFGRRYPWWSVDSSSWTSFQRYGKDVGANGRHSQSRTGTRAISGHRPVADMYYYRVVRRWRRLEDSLDRLWAGRGITYRERSPA
jgi:hypothetical protein